MDQIQRYREQRRRALERGDHALVREITFQLQQLGYFETVVQDAPIEQAIPVKRGPGRPRKYPKVE